MQVAEAAAGMLKTDGTKLRFYGHNDVNNVPSIYPVTYSPEATLDHMLRWNRRRSFILYVEHLDIPIQELESKYQVCRV